MTDISFRKPEFVIDFKFALSGSPRRHERAHFVHRKRRRPPARRIGRRAGGSGRDSAENTAERRRAGRKSLEAEHFGFLPL